MRLWRSACNSLSLYINLSRAKVPGHSEKREKKLSTDIFAKKTSWKVRWFVTRKTLFFRWKSTTDNTSELDILWVIFSAFAMKCLGFTFSFYCLPSLVSAYCHTGSVLNLFLLLTYLPFHFRERPIHFHFTTSVLRGSEKGPGNSSRQTNAQERTHPRNEWKAILIQQRFGLATISSSWLQTSKATELMHQGVLVPVRVLGSSICQMLQFRTAHQ
jgi:hypothetical protein